MRMSKLTKKELEDKDLLERTRERVDRLYKEYEAIFIANSGGKDSGAVFNVVMDGWERNKDKMDHPIYSIFHDAESNPFPDTEAYLKRQAEKWSEESYLFWSAVPYKISLMTHPEEREHNIPWNPEQAEDWCRPLPTWVDGFENVELVRPDHPYLDGRYDFESDQYTEIAYHIIEGFKKEHGLDGSDVVNLVGLRAEESLNRYTTIINNGGFLKKNPQNAPCDTGHPVFDWGTDDLFQIHEEQGWDYTEFYDKMHQIGLKPTQARNGTPFGGHPIASETPKLQRHWYPEFYEAWEQRHPGTVFAFEFGFDLFDMGEGKPDDVTWEEYAAQALNSFDDDEREKRVRLVNNRLESHWNHSDVPLKETDRCPVCDLSWRQMAEDLVSWLKDYNEREH